MWQGWSPIAQTHRLLLSPSLIATHPKQLVHFAFDRDTSPPFDRPPASRGSRGTPPGRFREAVSRSMARANNAVVSTPVWSVGCDTGEVELIGGLRCTSILRFGTLRWSSIKNLYNLATSVGVLVLPSAVVSFSHSGCRSHCSEAAATSGLKLTLGLSKFQPPCESQRAEPVICLIRVLSWACREFCAFIRHAPLWNALGA